MSPRQFAFHSRQTAWSGRYLEVLEAQLANQSGGLSSNGALRRPHQSAEHNVLWTRSCPRVLRLSRSAIPVAILIGLHVAFEPIETVIDRYAPLVVTCQVFQLLCEQCGDGDQCCCGIEVASARPVARPDWETTHMGSFSRWQSRNQFNGYRLSKSTETSR